VANIKTLTDDGRIDLNLDRSDVFEVMPGHYDELYPNLALFLQKYYETLDQEGNPADLVNELLTNRDVVSVQQEFLVFLSNELLLGKPYFEQFNDKRTALQFSNLLYRSKGTEYSIQQFFRIFYSLDVDVSYGRDYILNVGDPPREHLEYVAKGAETGSTFKYTFSGAPVEVYTRDSAGLDWIVMRQDIDYIQNFTEKRVEFLQRSKRDIDEFGYVADTPFYERLAETSFLGEIGDSDHVRLKVITEKNDYSFIGSSTPKRLTNDKFYQLFALMIQTDVSVDVWREAYKTFVHPAGMYLAGRVQVNSMAKVRVRPFTVMEPPEPPAPAPKVFSRRGKGKMSTSVSELGPGPYGYVIRSRVNDLQRKEYQFVPNSEALLVGTQDSDGKGWGHEYFTLHRADNINARTLDEEYITLSNTINTLDENVWIGQDSDGRGNPWLPGNIDVRPPGTFYLSTEGDLFLLTQNGELIEL
jgi:hypothetical protein